MGFDFNWANPIKRGKWDPEQNEDYFQDLIEDWERRHSESDEEDEDKENEE